ncbi:2-oxoglutarate and iron-dependent oxygenase domain-containing protein [Methylopila sp. M107]|uniref:isopenicillin N synthase family dioxygenase n=1 Tax=Methylopila sp. M107 TaxID=1101190 RepID=UPI00036DE8AC|nr:2-oxoglutarate and iron-dependent oxygenase domain-containing protein [Methylopila sp. M107]
MSETLPTIDLRRSFGSADDRKALLAELRMAARDPGFFYLVGHGVPETLTKDVLALSRRFFSLPDSDKLAIEMARSPHFRGYTRAGAEITRGRPDWREQVDVGREGEALAFDPAAPAWRRLVGPNQWPAALPQLRPVLLDYLAVVTRLGVDVLRLLSASLGQPEEALAPIYTPEPNQLLKIIRYPGRDAADGGQGVGAHKDSGFLTVLLQDETAGLQVETERGWIQAPPVAGTFVVNVGEVLELASNGYLRANVHRVVAPPAQTDRLSVAFFLGARLDATVPVLDIPPSLAADARGVTQDPLNPLFRDVGRNFLKSRLRSHPDVARRHHADLLDPAESAAPASAY